MGLKALVLNGDDRLLQVLGDVVQIRPDAVLRVHEQRLIHDPLLGIRVLIVQLRGDAGLKLVQIYLHVAPQGAVDVCHKDPGKDGHGQHAHQHDRADDPARLPPAVALLGGHVLHPLLRFVLEAVRALLRILLYVPGALLQSSHKALGRTSALVFTQDRAPSFLSQCITCNRRDNFS